MSLRDQIREDLDFIFDTDGLAVPALWKSGSKPEVSINGIFESVPNVEMGKYTGMAKSASYNFSFACRFDDVKEMKRQDILTLEGRKFYVALDPINNYGFTTIILNEKI